MSIISSNRDRTRVVHHVYRLPTDARGMPSKAEMQAALTEAVRNTAQMQRDGQEGEAV